MLVNQENARYDPPNGTEWITKLGFPSAHLPGIQFRPFLQSLPCVLLAMPYWAASRSSALGPVPSFSLLLTLKWLVFFPESPSVFGTLGAFRPESPIAAYIYI